jgi:hypothetical protein
MIAASIAFSDRVGSLFFGHKKMAVETGNEAVIDIQRLLDILIARY